MAVQAAGNRPAKAVVRVQSRPATISCLDCLAATAGAPLPCSGRGPSLAAANSLACFNFLLAGVGVRSWAKRTEQDDGLVQDEHPSIGYDQDWAWDWQPDFWQPDGYTPSVQAEAEAVVSQNQQELQIITMSGVVVANLLWLPSESTVSLKRRIQKAEGTSPHVQKLIQGGKILQDSDIVHPGVPVSLVRVQRKIAIFASVYSDLRFYDVETGEAMRSHAALNLRLACLKADWSNVRCFTGSCDGTVRVWDTCTGECLQTFEGDGHCVSMVSSDNEDRLLAATSSGLVQVWSLKSGKCQAHVKTEARGQFLVCVNWPRSRLEDGIVSVAWLDAVATYNLKTGAKVWSLNLASTGVIAFNADWESHRCLVAYRSGTQRLELRRLGGTPPATAKSMDRNVQSFGPASLDPQGLICVDWESERALMVVQPYALELWSISKRELLCRLRDSGGDGTELVSLDVNWTSVPQAIIVRHYIDWELVDGQTSIQHWEVAEGARPHNVIAEHPTIGGFDVVAAAAQF